ncbi:MAG TPA: RNA-binding domain-containing protein [Puia sp.]|jgi:ATP-dependent DNA helicase RecG
MTPEKLHHLLQQGEGIDIEFKTARFELNKDAFDSICAFLNRKGGHLLLGVTNNGQAEGVIESAIPAMVNHIITSANNPGKLDPPCYLSPQVIEIAGRKLIYVYVPESSMVHNHSGRTFDRNGDADVDITRQPFAMRNVHLRKHTEHMENQVYPHLGIADLDPSLFKEIRIRTETNQSGHPWSKMSDLDLIRSARLYKTDPATGKEGLTLAGILLLGKEEVILDVLPHHRTDAILRVEDLDRYDDRDFITTNLMDSFNRLMAFIAKHLPDKFYLEGAQRISLRHRLFREVVVNLLIHREFTNRFPAKLIIQRDRVYTENWSLPRGWGQIDPLNFVPHPKNPVIANFFRQIGHADELGSGVRKIFRDSFVYTPGTTPQLVEGDIFKTVIPLRPINFHLPQNHPTNPKNDVENDVENGVEKLDKNELRILQMIRQNSIITISELARKLKVGTSTVQRNIARLKTTGILERIGPDKGGHWKIHVP